MAEWEDDEMALLEELRESDGDLLDYYKATFLDCTL